MHQFSISWLQLQLVVAIVSPIARLILLSQKVAFWELGIFDNFGRFVFRHEELRWIT